MTSNIRWSMPSWDKLFAGRKASLGEHQIDGEERRLGETPAEPTQSSSVGHSVAMIAVQDQNQLEEELQGAVKEPLPGTIIKPSLAAPRQAHLDDMTREAHLLPSSSLNKFPDVIRRSIDSAGISSTSNPPSQIGAKATSSSPGVTAAHIHANGGSVDGPKKPAETWQPKPSDSIAQHHIKSVSTVYRGGRQESSDASSNRASMDAMTSFSDMPSGQWAEGVAPSSTTDGDIQKDLWDTLTSLFGVDPAFSSSKETDTREGFFGAVSRLQGILGESQTEEAKWRKDREGEIDRAFQQSATPTHDDNSAGEGEGYEAKSGIRHQPTYLSPRLPIVFAHGLFGFGTLDVLPGLGLSFPYWRGIADTLKMRGVEVLVAKVPMSASIEERAESLRDVIEKEFPHREINLIGHSMGGLDGRYLASKLDSTFTIRSLTTIATPHRGSTFADFMLDRVIGKERLPKLLNLVEKSGMPGGGRAFACLTTHAMKEFNENVEDSSNTTYMSWGAAHQPGYLHEFRIPWGIVKEAEGDNDGLVSVESSKWAEYRGTLTASHLDLIGWTNRVASLTSTLGAGEKPFDPKALYLTICEDLALRGL